MTKKDLRKKANALSKIIDVHLRDERHMIALAKSCRRLAKKRAEELRKVLTKIVDEKLK